ncbi:MAG: cysteine hydrolase family protein [Halorientalis sp.]
MARTDAVLTVDLHHGHLDPDVATLPLPAAKAEAVIDHASELTAAARRAGVPVLHVTSAYRNPEEILSCPKWRPADVDVDADNLRDVSGIGDHNPVGTKLTEVMPAIRDDEYDVFTHAKKRYSPFLHTDLEFLLDQRDVDRLFVAGVNTNSCVQCTCFEACNRDYEVVVVEDCVDSMDGEAYHEAALENIEQVLGTVVSLQDAVAELNG